MNTAILTKRFLESEYIKKRKPIAQISKEIKCSVGSIWNYLVKFEIKTRTKSELWTGENNPNFNGMTDEHRKNISISRKGKRSNHFKNGKMHNSGYTLIFLPEHPFSNNLGYVREHRLVLENHLNRYLKPNEVTHHVNKIRNDNRIKNLMLFNSHSAHVRFEKAGLVKPEEIIFDGRIL